MIIVDSREKKWSHIEEFLIANNIPYVVKKLDQGDYLNTENPLVVVDRKQNLDECAANLCTKDSDRFWREIRHAKENGIKVIVLCEHSDRIKTINDVPKWTSKWSKITGKKLSDEMFKVHVAYGVDWKFCDKSHTAEKILELLNYDK